MDKSYVDGKMLVGEVVKTYPEAVEVLMQAGMHCLGCSASQAEALEDACKVHSLDAGDVIARVNAKIAEVRG